MLEDLDFKVGDGGNLRGRGIIFCENLAGSENPFNPRFPALAVAPDPSELLDLLSAIAPLPDNIRDALLDKIRQSAELWSRTMFGQPMYRFVREMLAKGLDQINIPDEIKDQLQEEMENIPDEPTGVPFHGCFMPLVGFDPSVIEPYEEKCDVIQAQAVPSVTYAGLVLSGHAQHYLAAHLLQREEAGNVDSLALEPDVPSAKDLTPSAFLDLLNKKVSELMYARESGEPLDHLIRQLRKLTAGTIFIRDVLNLSKFFDTSHPRKIEIIDLNLQRISLLAQEEYEKIPDLDTKLKALLDE
ncbi:MAG: hypothetical protein ACYTFG_12010 [Planctomycetota bacterium]|jgi:hypothetical protein